MRHLKWKWAGVIVLWLLAAVSSGGAPASGEEMNRPVLDRAVMCEGVRDLAPLHPAIVFSIDSRRVSCFSTFRDVREKTHIFHCWYHRDKLSTKIKLYLKPPKWSTFSTIQLRETDKGPWRLEIKSADGTVLRVLQFSIAD